MPRRRYEQVEDGKWVRMSRTGESVECCECSLVHRLKFRIVDGHIEMQFHRDDRTTAALRRKFQW